MHRLKAYDMNRNIWLYQKRMWLIFWVTFGTGPKEKFQEVTDLYNKYNKK